MGQFIKRRITRWLSVPSILLLLPIVAFASASLTWTPPSTETKSPVTISVSTTGDFRDVVDGIGCDLESYTNWTIHVVGAIGELFGVVMGSGDRSATDIFELPLGPYAADVACSEAPVQQNNGQSNNPSLSANFDVMRRYYYRTPSGLILPSTELTIDVGFDDFSVTGCAADAESWRVALYDATGEFLYAATSFLPSTTLSVSQRLVGMPRGEYGTVEFECMWGGQLYGGSEFLENDNGGVIFTIPYLPSRVDEDLASPTSDAVRPLPTVTFAAPKANDRMGKVFNIMYDVNFEHFDSSVPYDVRGLAVTSVSLYYATDKDGLASTTLIASQLLAKGEYAWEVINMPERDDYRLVVVATDNVGRVTTLSSENFSIDHTPPAFRLTVDPPVSQGEEVTISVDAEEDLDETSPPRVRVEQQYAGPITLTTKGSGKHFETIYYPVHGHDGEVKMTIVGQDKAKNESDKIVSGGLFYVGIEPPPKPAITYPLENDVFSSSTTDVIGVSRAGTEVALFANGVLVSKKKVDFTGEFIFKNVPISKNFQRGINAFSVVAYDQAGHQSESTLVRIKYNIPPKVLVSAPKDGEILSRATAIKAIVKDDNNDSIRFTYELSSDGGATWGLLAKNSKNSELKWRTMDFLDGEYILRVTVDDGFEKAVAQTGVVQVRNYLPRVEFVGKNKAVINSPTITISGSAGAENPAGLRRSPIRDVEYRIGDEEVWHKIKNTDVVDDFLRTFSLELSGLMEGAHQVRVRATDERGYYGVSVKTVVVDYGPPQSPKVAYPMHGSVLTQQIDEDSDRAGVQFTLRGTAEPHAQIEVVVEGATMVSGVTATSGAYVIPGVTLRKHGVNSIMVTATDIAGNTSVAHTLSATYNNPPTIKFRSPRAGRGINHQATVRWDVSDPDGDTVRPARLSWRPDNTGKFKAIASSITGNSVAWDVSQFAESKNYELRLEVSDGTSESALVQRVTIDNTPPTIAIIPLTQSRIRKEFTLIIEGDATDELSGIEYVEYSINGNEWYKGIITKGYLGKQAHFKVKHPLVLSDGKYTLQFRAVDGAGVVSALATQALLVDTTAPRVGSHTLGIGTAILQPTLVSLADSSLPVFRSLIGESLLLTQSLESDTASATLRVQESAGIDGKEKRERIIPLTKDPRTGLWRASVLFDTKGKSTLSIFALDKLGNSTNGIAISSVETHARGVVRESGGAPIAGAKATVLAFNEDEQRFVPWNGKPYGLVDEKETDSAGEYAFLLPAGTYQFLIQKTDFSRIRSGVFTLTASQFVSSDFLLERRKGLRGTLENVLEFLSPS